MYRINSDFYLKMMPIRRKGKGMGRKKERTKMRGERQKNENDRILKIYIL